MNKSFLLIIALAAGGFYFLQSKKNKAGNSLPATVAGEQTRSVDPRADHSSATATSTTGETFTKPAIPEVNVQAIKAEIKKETESIQKAVEEDRAQKLALLNEQEKKQLAEDERKMNEKVEQARKEEQERFDLNRQAALQEEAQRRSAKNSKIKESN